MQSSTPTLARRYAFKLLANVASVPVYLAMEALLPRALGPRMYGHYSFATNLFQQLSGFLDMGTSTCFYNALSRRQNETGLVGFYLRVSLLVALISLLAALCMLIPPVGEVLMPDVPLWLAPLAALWAFLTWWGRVLRSMNDAVGATVSSEMVRTVVSLLAVVLLGALFWGDWLNIHSLFAQQYLMLEALFHALCQRSNGLRLIAGGLILGMNLKGGHSSPPPFPYGCKYYTTNYKGGSVQTPPPRKLN